MHGQRRLDGLRVAILVTDAVEQVEMAEPRAALDAAGARTRIVPPKPGQVQGMQHDVTADTFPVDLTLGQAKPDDFDAVLLPGGALNADSLRVHRGAQAFVRRMQEREKPIAVICHAPWLLVSAGLARGRTLTSYPTLQDHVRNAGGQRVDREVVGDGNRVSSRQPADIPAFAREMTALLAEHRGRQGKRSAA